MRHPNITNRRRMLKQLVGGTAALGIGSHCPQFLLRAAESASGSPENVLVVVQLSGGNDGLNTVVPYSDEAYRKARPKLHLSANEVLKINADLGLHPSLSGVNGLLDDGMLSVIQGVGYANPNRSHFESMDIWHTCKRKEESRSEGWIGRFLDERLERALNGGGALIESDVPALHLGDKQQPMALTSRNVRVPSLRSVDEFRLRGAFADELQMLLSRQSLDESSTSVTSKSPSAMTERQSSSENDLLGFLKSSTASAVEASQRVTAAVEDAPQDSSYPETELGKKLSTIAQLVDSGLSTKIYYVELDGFDTHAEQSGTHSVLLRQWSDAVTAFMRDLESREQADRVCVMTFSEFGRRVAENASEGTDHGAAAPMFLCGGAVQSGIVGTAPDLNDLQAGDLKHSYDFRQVYATVLQDWLLADPSTVIGKQFTTLDLFKGV